MHTGQFDPSNEIYTFCDETDFTADFFLANHCNVEKMTCCEFLNQAYSFYVNVRSCEAEATIT